MMNDTKNCRLRVIKFDDNAKVSDPEVKIPTASEKTKTIKDVLRSSPRHSRIPDSEKSVTPKLTKLSLSKSSAHIIARIPKKRKVSKKHVRRKTSSVEDFKRMLTLRNNIHSDKYRDLQQVLSKAGEPKGHKRDRRKNNNLHNHRKWDEDIKVIYTSETKKFPRRTRRRQSPDSASCQILDIHNKQQPPDAVDRSPHSAFRNNTAAFWISGGDSVKNIFCKNKNQMPCEQSCSEVRSGCYADRSLHNRFKLVEYPNTNRPLCQQHRTCSIFTMQTKPRRGNNVHAQNCVNSGTSCSHRALRSHSRLNFKHSGCKSMPKDSCNEYKGLTRYYEKVLGYPGGPLIPKICLYFAFLRYVVFLIVWIPLTLAILIIWCLTYPCRSLLTRPVVPEFRGYEKSASMGCRRYTPEQWYSSTLLKVLLRPFCFSFNQTIPQARKWKDDCHKTEKCRTYLECGHVSKTNVCEANCQTVTTTQCQTDLKRKYSLCKVDCTQGSLKKSLQPFEHAVKCDCKSGDNNQGTICVCRNSPQIDKCQLTDSHETAIKLRISPLKRKCSLCNVDCTQGSLKKSLQPFEHAVKCDCKSGNNNQGTICACRNSPKIDKCQLTDSHETAIKRRISPLKKKFSLCNVDCTQGSLKKSLQPFEHAVKCDCKSGDNNQGTICVCRNSPQIDKCELTDFHETAIQLRISPKCDDVCDKSTSFQCCAVASPCKPMKNVCNKLLPNTCHSRKRSLFYTGTLRELLTKTPACLSYNIQPRYCGRKYSCSTTKRDKCTKGKHRCRKSKRLRKRINRWFCRVRKAVCSLDKNACGNSLNDPCRLEMNPCPWFFLGNSYSQYNPYRCCTQCCTIAMSSLFWSPFVYCAYCIFQICCRCFR